MRYVIVGNGVAGTTAALHARRQDPGGDITIVSDESLPFYSRIRLIDYLAGTVPERDLVIFREGWYQQNRLKLLQGRKVVSLSPAGSARLEGGEVLPFDRLLLATGSRPAPPPIAGVLKEGVFMLRTFDDACRIVNYLKDRQHVIILGGGVLGIEIGNALLTRDKTVAVIELFPRLLPRQTDPEGSRLVQRLLETKGLAFRLGVRVRGISGSSSAEGIILDDGTSLRGDAVIVAAGVRPVTGLAASLGLACTGGIPVNDRMETAVPGVYAAGDAASHRGICYGLWAAAEKQGEIAGINMAGGEALYPGTLPSHVLKVAGIQLLAAGDIDPDGRLTAHVRSDPERGAYRKLVTRGGRLVGCILIGDLSGRREILAAISSESPLDSLGDALIQ